MLTVMAGLFAINFNEVSAAAANTETNGTQMFYEPGGNPDLISDLVSYLKNGDYLNGPGNG
ncbi:hypothetical protein [Lactiplantibacillus plajomi]|uniref:Uncharacterized protein n=1 Tax=Lactiplantibacillus plajomi TaxID=1457217 RepID=A0ABV6K6X8_9LACO